MTQDEKNRRYHEIAAQIASVLEHEDNLITRMATVSCLLAYGFESYFWTGFYMVDPKKPLELVVGPYQGSLGCLRIPFGKGVCGRAASEERTQIVADVDAFPGHIACDQRSRSEIVVPVFDAEHRLIAVFDVDSEQLGNFDETDQRWLEQIIMQTFAQ
ncbi:MULTISPECIES: GAF domain-containing protein [unclassified Iodidimonas]|jgi:GAF domain-containing protein|uniref:GAF domain-containing protein n=1 Tax=unclassified Iodidimonas TaxID=2626145 RepID=UPI002482AE3C|nr:MULTISPECIES: GAF domain-containing protein [unclassified Iodidimonas]